MKNVRTRFSAAIALVAGVFCASGAAAQGAAANPATQPVTRTTADYTETVAGDQVVTFGGDQLDGDPNSAYGFTLRRPPGIIRHGLIRPRTNFVSELLKSVENL